MKEYSIDIGGRKVGASCPPFIIAELSANHQQSLASARQLIFQAAKAGVSAIKLQTYKPATMTLNINSENFVIGEKDSLWYGRKLYDLYSEGMTPWDWHQELFDYADSLGLIGFSSPFDDSAVDMLEDLAVPAYKVASFELTHHPLLKRIAQTGKPVILSTGMASIEEIQESLSVLKSNGAEQIALLKCTSTYPANVENSNLLTIPRMIEKFKLPVGLSDHTCGIGAAVASVALGGSIIEKHIVLDRTSSALDAKFSSSPDELTQLVTEANNVWTALGKVTYGPSEAEQVSLKYRRSLYFIRALKAGDVVTQDDVAIVRPAFGLAPSYYERIVGEKLVKSVEYGTPVTLDCFAGIGI